MFLIPSEQNLLQFRRAFTEDDEPKVVTQAVQSIQIAPQGMSGNKCRQGHFLPFVPSGVTENLCKECGGMPTDQMGILARDVELLEQPAKVLSRVWWHSSNNPLFCSDPNTAPVHLGSRKAAQQRSETEGYTCLYELRLRPEAQVSPQAFIESEYYDPGHVTMTALALEGKVVRYVNNSEEAGGISLVTLKANLVCLPDPE